MDINPFLLSKILDDQKKAWALLEKCVKFPAFNLVDSELKHEIEEYLTPIRAGLAKIQEATAKAKAGKVEVVKGRLAVTDIQDAIPPNPTPVQSNPYKGPL